MQKNTKDLFIFPENTKTNSISKKKTAQANEFNGSKVLMQEYYPRERPQAIWGK